MNAWIMLLMLRGYVPIFIHDSARAFDLLVVHIYS